MNYLHRFFGYIKSSRLELKQVNWPSRKESLRLSLLVIGISLGVAAFLGLADYILTTILDTFIL